MAHRHALSSLCQLLDLCQEGKASQGRPMWEVREGRGKMGDLSMGKIGGGSVGRPAQGGGWDQPR